MAEKNKRYDYEEEPEGYEPIEIPEHYSHSLIDFALDNFDARITALEEIHEYNSSIADQLKKSKTKLDRTIAKGEESESGGTKNATGNSSKSKKRSANPIKPSYNNGPRGSSII